MIKLEEYINIFESGLYTQGKYKELISHTEYYNYVVCAVEEEQSK